MCFYQQHTYEFSMNCGRIPTSNIFRHELNTARSNQVQSQRYINDLGAQKKTVETQLQHALEDRQRLGSHLQGQIDYHATNAQRLQATLENLQNQPLANSAQTANI